MECIIREWRIEDAVSLAKIISNKKIQDNLRDGLPYPYTVKDAEDFINTRLAADKNTIFAFAVTADNNVVGSVGISRCGNIHFRTAEIGYYVAEEYWSKGIATSAIKQACGYVFKNTDIIRIFAQPFSYNTASCRALEKAGFKFEGIMRKNAVKNGRIIDMKMYALVKSLP